MAELATQEAGVSSAAKAAKPMSLAQWAWLAVSGLAGLAAALKVYAAGEVLLAMILLATVVFALWIYGSRHTHALRYLFPGLATCAVFVVFPMLYTMGLGFTNYSSANLLSAEQSRSYLLEQRVQVPGSERAFVVVKDLNQGLRVHLPASENVPALQSEVFQAQATAVAQAGAAAVATANTRVGTGPNANSSAGADAAAKPLALAPVAQAPSTSLSLKETVELLPTLRQLTLRMPAGQELRLGDLRSFAQWQPLYREPSASVAGHVQAADAVALVDQLTQQAYKPDGQSGFFTSASGDKLTPGYRVGVGLEHYTRMFTEAKFREPFISVLVWTIAFSALSIVGAAGLGLLLAVLLNWEALRFKGLYRLVLFLPYAVPGFISILIFKGLFNQNLGEINLILNELFGIRPAWFSDPWLARTMLVIVNIWLGFPYMMVLCSGLIKSIPVDLYEASAVSGAGPWVNFKDITVPLILKPLTPLLISAFAFNFNNFVLVSLLTNGRPDQVGTTMPAGTTDILVSYTWRIAFQDSSQEYGLASAISTVIFLIVAAITLLQMRATRVAQVN